MPPDPSGTAAQPRSAPAQSVTEEIVDGATPRQVSLVPMVQQSADARAAQAAAADAADTADDGSKYSFESLIAEGAEGRVYVVHDRDLERKIAMKVMRPGTSGDVRRVQRFLNEARRTAALAHAAIPAVHDLGYVATGELFFTMRLVEGRTLRAVFDRLCADDPETSKEWTLVRIVQVIQHVAAAVDYAHCHGVIHRDLKPENIAVSEFHEVLVLDWGLSKRIGRDPDAQQASVDANPFATQIGAVKGTPLYMPPEQARGAIDQLDQRADVFSLGAILYEAVCREPPYDGQSAEEVLEHAKAGEIVPLEQRQRGRGLPRALVDTCMRALSADPDGRHANAKAFADDLQGFLEGTKERELRGREATSLVESANRLVLRARTQVEDSVRMDQMADEMRRQLATWAPEAEKVRVWQLEDGASRTRVEAADTHARATDLVSRALALDAEHPEARATVARLYFDRFVDAERHGRIEDATWLRRMVERYDDGALGSALRDTASLLVETVPEGASVVLARIVERNRRRIESDVRDLGVAPLADASLASGDWLVCASHPECETVRVPIRIARGEERMVRVRLPRKGFVLPGFALVPAGRFLAGQFPDVAEAETDDFAIMERPVLLSEYAAWLDDTVARDPDAAAIHVPWLESHGPLLHVEGLRHVFCPASPLSRRPITDLPDLPVVGVTRTSAEAYAAWLGARLGVELTLPTELQWEKAARGTDGRLYPWGDSFDPTFCSMLESTHEEANLRPVAAFAADVSPYGVRDLAGGVREWCRDDVDVGRRLAVCRGGAWYLRGRECTVTSRWIVEGDTRNPGIGFRLCREG